MRAEGRTVLDEAQAPRVDASLGFYCSDFIQQNKQANKQCFYATLHCEAGSIFVKNATHMSQKMCTLYFYTNKRAHVCRMLCFLFFLLSPILPSLLFFRAPCAAIFLNGLPNIIALFLTEHHVLLFFRTGCRTL